MRRTPIACAAVLWTLVVSCGKNIDNKSVEPIIPVPPGMEYVEISTAKELINGDTKAFFVGDDIYWNGNDSVAVYDDKTVSRNIFKVKEGSDIQYATLFGLADDSWDILYAVAPAESVSGLVYSEEAATATVSIPSNQTISENVNVDRKAMISMSKVTRGPNSEPVSTPFKNACSYIRFKFAESDVSEITVTALKGEILAGTFEYEMSGNEVSIGDVTDGTSAITLKPSGACFEKNKAYIIPVLASANGRFSDGFRFVFLRGSTEYFCPYPKLVEIGRSEGISLGELTSHSGRVDSAPSITIENSGIYPVVSSNSLIFRWSESDSEKSTINNYYNICLYSDAECTEKIEGTELLNQSDVSLGASAAGKPVTYQWSELNPSTTYYCRVQNSYNGKFSNIVSATTYSN